MSAERFTWIGQVTSDSSAGDVARGFVRGLGEQGVPVQVLDSGDGALASDFDCAGPVCWMDTTVVRHASLSMLATTAAILPIDPRARQVAYVVADAGTIDPATRAVLERCDEVWAPSLVQLEILRALGIPRGSLRVIAPGVADSERSASPARASGPSTDKHSRVLVVGGSTAIIDAATDTGTDAALGAEIDARIDALVESARARPGTRAFAAEIARADLVVVLSDVDPWGRAALEALRQGVPLAHVESGIAAEHAGEEDCAWIEAGAEPARVQRRIAALLADRIALEQRAERARARLLGEESLFEAARRLIARTTEPRVLPEPRLSRALSDLGLPTPLERLSGSRADVRIVPVHALDGGWRADLRRLVAQAEIAERATICLWVDEACASAADCIAAAAEAEIAAAAADPAARRRASADPDVLVVVAPIAHAPRERCVTSCA